MGWFLVNLLLPSTLPLLMLLGSKLAPLPTAVAANSRVIRAVRDGQLGWIAMAFAASCAYDLSEYPKNATPAWAGYVSGGAIAILVFAGFFSTLGTLFPFDDATPKPAGWSRNPTRTWFGDLCRFAWRWVSYFRMLAATAAATLVAAALYALVHYSTPAAHA